MATEAVLNYLRSTNRPYSANDILINMHKEHGKTAIQKALDSLVLDNKVLEKTYGKQKVYVIKQDNCVDGLQDEIKELDEKILVLTNEAQDVEAQLKEKDNELKNIQTSLTTEEARKQVEIASRDLEAAANKLEALKNKATVPVSPTKLETVTKKRQQVIKEYKSRKRICSDILSAILDGYPKSKKELLTEIGIETDEDVQFILNEI